VVFEQIDAAHINGQHVDTPVPVVSMIFRMLAPVSAALAAKPALSECPGAGRLSVGCRTLVGQFPYPVRRDRNRGRILGSRGVQVGFPRQRMRSGRYGMTGWPGMLSRSPR
jgi:hypothetical protein